MNGLMIKNDIYWHPRWSSEIGQRFPIKDSTKGLFIFDATVSREEILARLHGIPSDSFTLIELEEVPEKDCEFMGDSGVCYRRTLQ
ncbi:hypothetical protein [Geoalkalibacter sp.]|uniref:hypothetical protein n=1 Tax=Geoalkalibacter sp. TaxID=3041440 RepID=UPI00272DF818|nr:hypothetical protein [Geoalkalibacter sp.]